MSTGTLRVILLWHMHQPYYKNLVTGEYRLPWVRLHASKDYYGMVKVLDEFPNIHQNFNLVPSLLTQIEDYVSGRFREPFYDLAAKPAEQLSTEEKRFALQYLFQANVSQVIYRYPRYRELYERFKHAGEDPIRAEANFSTRDYRDLQVLSQVGWLDEFWLSQADVKELIKKGENFSASDQQFVLDKQREILKSVVPAYRAAAERGQIEISATPFYHPILPLVCDTNMGAVSSPGLALPQERFNHPEDAELQMRRALDYHEKTFGVRPRGMWPSEGSLSEEVLALGSKLGLQWMATDEGVLGRSLNYHFERDGNGRISADGASLLYKMYRYEKGDTRMNLVFRDHRISDLIGFVYAGMPARDAASHLLRTIKESAEPLTKKGAEALVPIILDGENAWETYNENGRDFLRYFYEGLTRDPAMQACTISEAMTLQNPKSVGQLKTLVPGSWIHANFNVWIGAQEDNKAWDYLAAARNFYEERADDVKPSQRDLALEELLIAEGSDWNWWYGPEHHSANDRDFDELYRAHLSNVYQSLGADAPDYLAQPISARDVRPTTAKQTAYIRPHIDGRMSSYFDWMGSAMYAADRRTSAMHGKQFLLDAMFAGIDASSVSTRVDFTHALTLGLLEFRLHIDLIRNNRKHVFRVDSAIAEGKLQSWSFVEENGEDHQLAKHDGLTSGLEVALGKIFEVRVPFALLGAKLGDQILLRFSVWKDRLPMDVLPVEGSIVLDIVPEEELVANSYAT